ncbi:MAG: VCBS repeat-containing protein, partial [Chloroflexi bacterium]|nr:VCBS repeat-containing protein [Chloroflexota bacterium]
MGVDGDSLPDSAELVLGTDPENMDTDGDMLDDWYEVKNGLDPLEPDSNGDGLNDYYEVTGVPLDVDGDGIPNAWDDDNDNDGVPDWLDLSPFSKSTVNESFHFDIKTSGNPTYIDFQLRPKDPEHLKLLWQTWDWPYDDKGTMQDLDNSTDDLNLVPMLELTMNQAPEKSEVKDYGIVIADKTIKLRSSYPWSSIMLQGGLGDSKADGDTIIADIDGNGKLDLLLMGIHPLTGILDPFGSSCFLYKIGWDMNTSGSPSRWSSIIQVTGFGNLYEGGGAAIADINGNGKLDLLLMGIDAPDGPNKFRYKIGWDLKSDGTATSWSSPIHVSGVGDRNAGGGAAIADIDGNGKLDLLLMGIDDADGPNQFRYRIGWDLTASGISSNWSNVIYGPETAHFTAGGGARIADIDGNGVPDLLLMAIDDSFGNHKCLCQVGWSLDRSGKISKWSSVLESPAIGSERWSRIGQDLNEGAGGKYIYLCVKESLSGQIKVISGDSSTISPGSGWWKINQDLNDGAGGKYIYLCVKDSLRDQITVISGNSSTISPGSGWWKINQDLNQGAGGKYIYLCVKDPLRDQITVISGDTETIYPPTRGICGGGVAIADINSNGKMDLLLMAIDDPEGSNLFRYMTGWDLEVESKVYVPLLPVVDNGNTVAFSGRLFYPASGHAAEILAEARLIWMVNGKSDSSNIQVISGDSSDISPGHGWGRINQDLNQGAGGKYIYLCVKEPLLGKVKVISGDSPDVPAGQGWTKIPQDLNAGAGGKYIYLCVTESLVGKVKVISGDSSGISPGDGWTKIPQNLNEGAGGKYIYLCVRYSEESEGLLYSTETKTLAKYREDFMLTGFAVEENFGCEAGLFYSDDANQTIRAYITQRYEFLNSSNTVSQADAKLPQYNITVNSTVRLFSHSDAMLRELTGDMITDALDSLPNGKSLPIAIATARTSSTESMDGLVSDSYILGDSYHIDMTTVFQTTWKFIKLPWYDTTTREQLTDAELLSEVASWDWRTEEKANVLLVLLAWSWGETNMSRMGDYDVPPQVPPEVSYPCLQEIAGTYEMLEHLRHNMAFPLVDATMILIIGTPATITWAYWSRVTIPKFIYNLGVGKILPQDIAVEVGKLRSMMWRATNHANPLNQLFRGPFCKEDALMDHVRMTRTQFGEWFRISQGRWHQVLRVAGRVMIAVAVLAIIAEFLYIAGKEGWTGFGFALAGLYAAMEIIYLAIIIGVSCIPVVGWAIALLILLADLIASCFGYGSAWVMEKVVDAFTDYDLRSEVNLDSKGTWAGIEDYGNNGLTVGDRIKLSTRLVEEVWKTGRGNRQDVDESYITPYYTYRVSDAAQAVSFGSVVSSADYGSSRWVEHEIGVWLEPATAMVNYPLTVWLNTHFKVYYDKSVLGTSSRHSYTDEDASTK